MTGLCGKQAKILSDETAAHLIVSPITITYPMAKSLIIMISLTSLNIVQVFTSSFVTLKPFCQKWDFFPMPSFGHQNTQHVRRLNPWKVGVTVRVTVNYSEH